MTLCSILSYVKVYAYNYYTYYYCVAIYISLSIIITHTTKGLREYTDPASQSDDSDEGE